MTDRRLALAAAGAAVLLLAAPLAAQQPRRATGVRPPPPGFGFIRGVVYDSLLGRSLEGARVAVRGTALRVVTDASGRFRLDSVPSGSVTLAWSHPGLDSAGLSNLSQRVTVEPGRPVTVDLTVPSHATMRRLACRQASTMGRDSGLVLGAVSDAETGERIAGAAVVVTWVTARRGPDGRLEVRRPRLEMLTDSVGHFYGCGVSTDLVATVQAGVDSFTSGVTELLIGPRGVARYDVTLSREDVPGARDTTGQRRGLATVLGTVRTENGLPRPSAVVQVDDAASMAYADSAGRFILMNQPSGSHMVMARMVGYSVARRRVDLRNRDTLRVELVMRQVTVLDTLQITARGRVAQNELADIQFRLRNGSGYYLTGEQVRERTAMRSVFQGLPSMTIEGRSVYDFTMYTMVSGRFCPVNLYVDGLRTDIQAIQSYRPSQIIAVEWYPRGNEGPARYQTLTDTRCGMLLIWTRFLQ
jgi:Carboxypeptidase regulatory-like domain